MRGLNYNAERAVYNGINVIGYIGVPDHTYEIDGKTAPVVRQIYEDYASGIPMQTIVNNLNKQGLKTNLGNPFSVNSIRHILTNRSYLGIYKWGEYEIPDGMPRIISDELFERVQKRLESNKRGGKGALRLVSDEDIKDYWLTGHVFCGYCGSSMQGVSGTGKHGNKFYYYSCKDHRHHKCSMRNIRKDLLEKIVFHILEEVVENPTNRLLIAEKCYEYYKSQTDDDGAYEAYIKDQLKETEKKIANLLRAIEAGVLTETTATRMKELEAEKSAQQDALITEQNRQKYDLKLEHILKWFESFTGDLTDEINRDEVLEDYLEKIMVFEDKVVVTFRYTEEERVFHIQQTSDIIDNELKIMDIMERKAYSGIVPRAMLDSVVDTEGEHSFF